MADTARYKKIDIYDRKTGRYLASTNQAKSPKQARVKYAFAENTNGRGPVDWTELRAGYAR
jgi:hypothetical protein